MNEDAEKVGCGATTRPHLRPLSKEAADARRPLPPGMLVDALQDRVHRDVGRGRAAKTVRVRRPSNEADTPTIEAAVDKIVDGLAPLLPGLLELQARAEALGVFLADRELLQCPDCGLMEDVTAHGILITYRGEPPGEDTGLRFKPLVAEGRFHCPSCGAEVEAPKDPDEAP